MWNAIILAKHLILHINTEGVFTRRSSEQQQPNPEATAVPTATPAGKEVKPAAVQAYGYMRHAVHVLNCSTCTNSTNSIKSVYFMASAQMPTYYNPPPTTFTPMASAARLHAGGGTNLHICSSDGYISTPDVSFGHLNHQYFAFGQHRIFYEIIAPADPACALNVTNLTVAPDVMMYYNIYWYLSGSTYHYVGRAWINNAWTQVFDTVMPAPISSIDVGWELHIPEGGMLDPDYNNNLYMPLNVVEKIRLEYGGLIYPLDRTVLPSALQNVVAGTVDWPLRKLDVYDPTNAFNDIAVKAN